MKKIEYVLVTGGAQGIGAGIVDRLIEDGYRPLVLDIAEPDKGVEAEFFRVDLGDAKSTSRLLAEIVEKFHVYRLVNNVGIVSPALLEDTSLEDFNRVIMLNAQTALLCIQALLPGMRQAKFGRVVSITSRTALGKEMRTAYSASKGAIASMTRTWALELAADGITVNAVAPGPIETEAFNKNNPPDLPQTRAIIERIPLQRLGKPDDVAQAVSFFLDENSSFITGQTLYVCGGITIGLNTN
jgi:NAD(P)-dependent dehydrogenase (short-subunit alcohol dehydrogenase family)